MQCPTCLCEVLNPNGYASRGTASDDADDDADDADVDVDDVAEEEEGAGAYFLFGGHQCVTPNVTGAGENSVPK